MRSEGLHKAEVIGLEYGIECQTTKDIHLSLMAFQLFCGCREFYLLIHSTLPSPARTEGLVREGGGGGVGVGGGPPGRAQSSGGPVCGLVEWHRLCEPLCADA